MMIFYNLTIIGTTNQHLINYIINIYIKKYICIVFVQVKYIIIKLHTLTEKRFYRIIKKATKENRL